MLEVKGLSAGYGSIQVLHGIDLRVKKASIVSLIGANGAGKTTTLMALSGLLKRRSGTVLFDGEDISKASPHKIVLKGISQVPEGRRVFGLLSVRENLELGAYLRNDKREVRKDIEKVESYFPILRERSRQAARTLSGGEQQMLAIGRALMARPRMLLLDEPSLGLAPLVVERIFQVIQKINKAGTTILLVEQNAFMALQISDHAYVIETGKVTFEDKASSLLKNTEIRKAYLGE
jgi:branched-chain amino acid transport system ATP-binding protein